MHSTFSFSVIHTVLKHNMERGFKVHIFYKNETGMLLLADEVSVLSMPTVYRCYLCDYEKKNISNFMHHYS